MGQIPSYFDIEVTNSSIESITDLLDNAPLGDKPCVIRIAESIKETSLVIHNIEKYLKTYNIDCNFPYPIYFISKAKINSDYIHILSHSDQLPNYFKVPNKPLNPLESELLYKVQLLTEKIKNFSPAEKFRAFNNQKKNHKELFYLTREAKFYETLNRITKVTDEKEKE